MTKLDLNKELNELRNQLSYSKRIGFFLGSGASKAVGISDIATLTKNVAAKLSSPEKDLFEKLLKDLEEFASPYKPNVEHVLDHLRLIRHFQFYFQLFQFYFQLLVPQDVMRPCLLQCL